MANKVSVFCCSKKYYPFIMKVNSGADSQITIPTSGSGYNYDLRVQGGQVWYGLTGNHTINFPSANTHYFIEISGEFKHYWSGGVSTNRAKMLDVIQCGGVEIISLLDAFSSLPNCVWSATDFLNTGNCNSMNYAFHNSPLINPDLSGCDLSSVNVMRFMFNLASSADKPFIHTETSSLTDMSEASFQSSKIPTIEIGATNLETFNRFSINSTYITRFILYGMKNSFSIERAVNVLGSEIDDMFTELGTASPSATITITTAQSTSGIDTTIATAKGWTIVIV